MTLCWAGCELNTASRDDWSVGKRGVQGLRHIRHHRHREDAPDGASDGLLPLHPEGTLSAFMFIEANVERNSSPVINSTPKNPSFASLGFSFKARFGPQYFGHFRFYLRR